MAPSKLQYRIAKAIMWVLGAILAGIGIYGIITVAREAWNWTHQYPKHAQALGIILLELLTLAAGVSAAVWATRTIDAYNADREAKK